MSLTISVIQIWFTYYLWEVLVFSKKRYETKETLLWLLTFHLITKITYPFRFTQFPILKIDLRAFSFLRRLEMDLVKLVW